MSDGLPLATAGGVCGNEAVETISVGENILAVIVRGWIDTPGISFFTPGNFSQQLAYMQHPAGKKIVPHVHNIVHRDVTQTLEALFIRKGRLRVDLYDDCQSYAESRVLGAGDVILLVSGGHGFETLEPVEMFEVKQGPYAGDEDKIRIEGVSPHRIQIAGQDHNPGVRTTSQWKRKTLSGRVH
jgi:mannose-6-phosphate isomerase-like protein (cupin superfamily)